MSQLLRSCIVQLALSFCLFVASKAISRTILSIRSLGGGLALMDGFVVDEVESFCADLFGEEWLSAILLLESLVGDFFGVKTRGCGFG